MPERQKISCIIGSKNAEIDMVDCLESVKWADEIIVVDDFSRDRTIEIARRYTDKVYQRRFTGYTEQKDFAVQRTSHRWILSLDADERVTPELRDEILQRLSSPPRESGYLVRRLNIFLNKEVRHCGWYEANECRLFDKERISFDITLKYLEKKHVSGSLGVLKHDLIHYTCRDLNDYFKRMNLWSTLNTEDLITKGVRVTPFNTIYYFILKPAAVFIYKYILKAGFLDGFVGFLISVLSAVTYFISYVKLLEIQMGRKLEPARDAGKGTATDSAGKGQAEKVGVVIVTYNNISMLASLLRDLLGQTRKPDEIIVIDNASVDNTASTIKESFPMVRYIRFNTNVGSAGGYREGVKLASEHNDLIWLLDDDVMVDKNALAPLIEDITELAETKKVGAVRSVGHAVFTSSSPLRTGAFAWRGTLIPTRVVKDIGLPRSDYFLYAEDVEYSMRMVEKGYEIYWVPNSKVTEQRMADKLKLSALGLRTVTYADAFRFYYANRNQINVCLEYHAFWSLFKSLGHTLKVMMLLVLAQTPNKVLFMKAIVRGIQDGVLGKLGEDERYLPGRAY